MKLVILITMLALSAGAVERNYELACKVLAQVESNGLFLAVGDHGRAVGLMQTWKIQVREVNRILGEDKYTYNDRFSGSKSREMVLIYLKRAAEEHPKDSEVRWLCRWRNPHRAPPRWYVRKISRAIEGLRPD